MKRFTILALMVQLPCFFCHAQTGTGQTAVASSLATNILYQHVNNPVEVAITDAPCKSILLEAGNAIVKGNGCYYLINPGGSETLQLRIATVGENDTTWVREQEFRVVPVPAPAAYFSGKTGNNVPIGQKSLSTAQGILAMMHHFPIDVQFEVVSYDALLATTDGKLERVHVEGHAVTPILKKLFSELQAGDLLFMENIRAKGPGGNEAVLEDISFIVGE